MTESQYKFETFKDKEFVHVGWVKDAHGIRGELAIHLISGQADWLQGLESFLLKKESAEVLTIEKVRPHKAGLIIKAHEIKDRTQAEQYKAYEFYIAKSLLESKPGEKIFLNEILNFQFQDVNSQEEGKIIGFESNGLQDLLVVENKNGKYLVPFVEAFIKEIQFENKVVLMDVPEGLFENSI